MKVLALIPARGGSKGIPRKNVRPLAGKPLIGWTIEAAKNADCINRVIVSTDDPEIASVAQDLGAEIPFMRPPQLATDHAPGIAPVLHAIEELPRFDWLLLLQPTSPLRTSQDIDGIFEFCMLRNALSAVSICETAKHPYWMYHLDKSDQLRSILPDAPEITNRQDLPRAFCLNGALYLAQTDWIVQNRKLIGPSTLGYLMPTERSADLDTEFDWYLAEQLIQKQETLQNRQCDY
ncbi:MAG: NTP transferase domain-containing protein [Verrucomicrobia bacterium]|nr:NTP transferase domain-containing protein [Verrucomicrobiota bacterium]